MPETIDRSGVVRATRDLTPRIRMIEIEPGQGFIPPSPGSHIDFSVVIGGRPDVRSYSVVGPCADGVYRIAVKLLEASRGGSAFMWSLTPGVRLAHSAPANHFGLALGAPEYLLLAGGIGVTPIFSHALALAHGGQRFRLLYACRSKGDLALADELGRHIGERLDVRLSGGGKRVDIAAEIARLDPRGEFYVCGPSGCSRPPGARGLRAVAQSIFCASRPSAPAANTRLFRSRSRSQGSAGKFGSPRTRPCSKRSRKRGWR